MRGSSARKCATPISGTPRSKSPEPLFELVDVEWMVERIKRLPYQEPHEIVPGVTLTYLDAGHILGSAIVQIDYRENGRSRRFVFTGDLGRRNTHLLPDPRPFRTSTCWSPKAPTAIASSIPTTG